MTASLGSLPQELLLMISRQIQPDCMQAILSESRQAVYEVETPEWKALRSLRLTSRTICRPAFDALSEAERDCKTLALNVFHLRGGSRHKHRVPEVVYQTYRRVAITLPLHFHTAVDSTTSAQTLFSFTFTINKISGDVWVCFPGLAEKTVELVPITTTGPTTPSPHDIAALRADLQRYHIGSKAPLLGTISFYSQGGMNLNPGLLTPQRLTAMLTRIRTSYRSHLHFATASGSRWTLSDPWHSALTLSEAKRDLPRASG